MPRILIFSPKDLPATGGPRVLRGQKRLHHLWHLASPGGPVAFAPARTLRETDLRRLFSVPCSFRKVISHGDLRPTTSPTQGNPSTSAASGSRTPIPDLTEIQTRSYDAFLQHEVPWQKRKDQGIEGVLREIFPIESYDKTLRLEYVRYELGKPRYEPDECRQLRLTYGRPFKVWLRLTKEQPVEEEVYLGDIPIMLGGGEFIINGAERVVVSQLHRSPGVDFVMRDGRTGDRRLHSCRIIPERGSWIELNVTRKESLARPHRPERQVLDHDAACGRWTRSTATDADLLRVFYRDRGGEDRRRPQRREDRRQAGRRRHRLSGRQPARRRGPRRVRPEDHQERRRDDLHLRPEAKSR